MLNINMCGRKNYIQCRAGSRIFRRGGRGPILGGFGLQRRHFSVKMYAKTKELGPVGGACAWHAPLDPPMQCFIIQDIDSWSVLCL